MDTLLRDTELNLLLLLSRVSDIHHSRWLYLLLTLQVVEHHDPWFFAGVVLIANKALQLITRHPMMHSSWVLNDSAIFFT